MPIEMVVKTERGVIVHRGNIYDSSFEAYNREFPLLSGIDPYGDTIFNRMQTERLVDEARVLVRTPLTVEQRASLVEIEYLCLTHVQSPPHRYLWFQGD